MSTQIHGDVGEERLAGLYASDAQLQALKPSPTVLDAARPGVRLAELVRIVDGTGAPRDRLAARLKSLEQMGVITRTPYQTAPPRFEYRLTDAGNVLAPVLDALRTWGLDRAVTSDDCDRHSWAKREQAEGS